VTDIKGDLQEMSMGWLWVAFMWFRV